jgi:hypothetical protein
MRDCSIMAWWLKRLKWLKWLKKLRQLIRPPDRAIHRPNLLNDLHFLDPFSS